MLFLLSSQLTSKEAMEQHQAEAANYHLNLALNKINSQDEKLKNQETLNHEQNEEIQSLKSSLTEVQTLLDLSPFNDSLTWQIERFQKGVRKGKKNHNYHIYKSFYTSKGYNIEILVYPNGNGPHYVDKSVSMFFSTTTGNFDDTLSWPLKAKIDYWALDEDGNPVHAGFFDTRTMGEDAVRKPPHCNSLCAFNFIPYDKVPLRNDTLTIKVKIEHFNE